MKYLYYKVNTNCAKKLHSENIVVYIQHLKQWLCKVKRKHYPYFLSALLIALTFGVAVVGYFAFQNLNEIIEALSEEVRPNEDLAVITDISNHLDGMENNIESYVVNKDSDFMDGFENELSQAINLISLLRSRQQDSTFISYLDTLETLIMNKSTLLSQVAKMDDQSIISAIKNLQQEISRNTPDSTSEVKNKFLRNLFNRKKVKQQEESAKLDQLEAINKKLDSIALSVRKSVYTQKTKELTLFHDHHDIDNKISVIIGQLETILINKMKAMSSDIKFKVNYTNRYIQVFSIASFLLLLFTLITLLVYVSRTRKHQVLLNFAKENALRIAKQKEQFLANMSHEIRTPMNAITGFSKMLLDSNLTEKQREYISIIDKSSDHLIHLLNDVLDLTKLQFGKIKLEKVTFNPKDTINEACQLHLQEAKKKGLDLRLTHNNLPEWLLGDPYRLRQIIINLLSNSLKFTRQGHVTIDARFESGNHNNGILHLEVSDTGSGIPPEMQVRIFEEFEQVNRQDESTGTGLGLAIIKKLVIIHKGKIKVESEPDKGTTFRIQLPYEISDAGSVHDTPSLPANSNIDLKGLKILVADDEIFNRKLLIEILGKHNIVPDESISGDETFEVLQSTPFDIVLLDFRMPKINGLEIAKRIREGNGPNKNVPIIGLTATIGEDDLDQARKYGINKVLRKPFKTEELISLISRLTDRYSPIPEVDVEYSLSGLEQMGDEAFVMEMIQTFIDSSSNNFDQLCLAVKNKNWLEAAEMIHKIVAPARHFRANKLVSILKQTELTARENKPISDAQLDLIQQELNLLINALKARTENEKQ